MNKILNLNSIFTKIILAVLSFAVIITIFVPYMSIPAVEAVRDINLEKKQIDIYIGKDSQTVNVVSELNKARPMLIYVDENRSETVSENKIPIPNDVNTYWVEFFAYGKDINAGADKLDYISLGLYKLVLNKGTKDDAKTKLSVDKKNKVITIEVANTAEFDFSRVIPSASDMWCKFDNRNTRVLENGKSDDNKITNISLDVDQTKQMYIAITLRSEITSAGEEKEVFYPLDMYDLLIYRDKVKNTLPTVGEFGLGISSAELSKTKGVATLDDSDTYMFIAMIVAALSTIFAFVIPAKFKIISTVISAILGVGLIVIPILDYVMFYGANNFEFASGFFILIALGVLILLAAAFDYYRENDEYRKEQIRIYGEDVFKKKK